MWSTSGSEGPHCSEFSISSKITIVHKLKRGVTCINLTDALGILQTSSSASSRAQQLPETLAISKGHIKGGWRSGVLRMKRRRRVEWPHCKSWQWGKTGVNKWHGKVTLESEWKENVTGRGFWAVGVWISGGQMVQIERCRRFLVVARVFFGKGCRHSAIVIGFGLLKRGFL